MGRKGPLTDRLVAATIEEKHGLFETKGHREVPSDGELGGWIRREAEALPKIGHDVLTTFVARVEQRFGSSVGMYYRFLRYVIFLELSLFFVWLFMVIVPWGLFYYYNSAAFHFRPQDLFAALSGSSSSSALTTKIAQNSSRTATGSNNATIGFNATTQARSTLWIYYSDYLPNMADGDMGVIYTAAVLVTYLFAVLVVLFNIGTHILRAHEGSLAKYDLAVYLYSWDWNLRDTQSAHGLMLGTFVHLVDVLQECRRRAIPLVKTSSDWLTPQDQYIMRRLMGALLSLGIIALALYIISVVLTELSMLDKISPYLGPCILTVVNLLIPSFIRAAVAMEGIPDLQQRISSELFRIFLTKMACVVFLVFQMSRSAFDKCTELVSGEIYIQLVLLNYGAEFLWTLLVQTMVFKCVGKLEFRPSSEMIDIYYREALMYIGSPYSPVIFLYGTIFNTLLFFLKYKIMCITNHPPLKPPPTRTGQDQLTCRALLVLTVVASFVPTFFFLTKNMTSCGPHKGSTPLQTFRDRLVMYSWVGDASFWIFHPLVLSSIAVLVGTATFFLLQITRRNSRQNFIQVRELEAEIFSMKQALRGGADTSVSTLRQAMRGSTVASPTSDETIIGLRTSAYISAWNSHNAEDLKRFLSADVVLEENGEVTASGREAFIGALSMIFQEHPQIHLAVEDIAVDAKDQKVSVICFRITGLNTMGMEMLGVDFIHWTHSGGQITNMKAFFSMVSTNRGYSKI